MRVSPGAGAGTSAEPPHMHHASHHHHNMDTNPLEGAAPIVESVVSVAGSSDGELSSKPGDSPTRKRRRISRHLSSGESNVSVTAPPVERRTPRHHYQPPRRVRYVSGNGAGVWHERLLDQHQPHQPHPPHPHPAHPAHPAHLPHAHHTPLLLDINQMSLRGARLSALGGGVGWPHPHPGHPHPAHPHPVHPHAVHPHQHPHRDHPTRTQIEVALIKNIIESIERSLSTCSFLDLARAGDQKYPPTISTDKEYNFLVNLLKRGNREKEKLTSVRFNTYIQREWIKL
ncbi:jg21802 [Pararge aegeria aegeria]|uniref:Jg21802 protein n=1 Tax=Pararge aegeria aegeria TaxID=348720 RepID=A0A8S4QJI1_9NEOP|nr:jg21802 [Pararge aegeria aegeria]